MCGLVGFFSPKGFPPEKGEAVALGMANQLTYRGPDDSGTWVDSKAGIALVTAGWPSRNSRRWDISMDSPTGRYVLVLNGEIYNHKEIRAAIDLGGHDWKGGSDTETLAAGIDKWGVEAVLQKCVGMFALAVWDRQQKVLLLARDRIGEKPLYYGWQGVTMLFGSELKSLRMHPDFRGEIDRDVLHFYLRHGYVPAPYSIYRGIFKLPPGTIVALSTQGTPGTLPAPVPYWSLQQVIAEGARNRFIGNEQQAIDGLEACISQAVKEQSEADVPLGAFLSGGVDSSTIVALMQANSPKRVKTFTVGFSEAQFNEAVHARAVARHLGTDHTELYVSPRDAMDLIPDLPSIYDEPFGDSSQIPSYLISKMAREHVTVALSGDGGDELFGGYERYQATCLLQSSIARVPRLARRLMGAGLGILSESALDYSLRGLFSGKGAPSVGARVKMLSQLMLSDSDEQFYQAKMSKWKVPGALVAGGREPETLLSGPRQWLVEGGMYDRMMYADAMSYLPDDILVKMDRAGMANSLETRMPLLDHRIVEFAWSLPFSLKVRPTQSKWLLRQVLYRYVPRELIERPKAGFAVPVDAWVKGPLRDWAEDLLSERRLREEGYFNPEPIRRRWKDHISGRYDSHGLLWPVLMFEAWLRAQSA